jgi:hypothetical protein
MDPKVQAWMDALFHTTVSPPWDELVEELKLRYLADDHCLRVELKLRATVQTGTLRAYMEQFQLMEATIILAGVDLNDREKVTQFVEGLAREQERYEVILTKPQSLKDCYTVVSQIRQAHTLSRHAGQPGQNQAKAAKSGSLKQLKSVRKEVLAKFPDKPARSACLRCGSKAHLLLLCPVAKQEWAEAYSGFAQALVKERCKSRGRQSRQERGYSEEAGSGVQTLTSSDPEDSQSSDEESKRESASDDEP